LAEPLTQLANKFAKLIKPQGKIALSGVLQEQTNQLLESYKPWFIMDEVVLKEEWARLSGTRKS
jgi:ribosomal protein L11 methyltransferase